ARQLTGTGTAITTDHSVVFTTATSDRFYLIGNPFARPLTVSAITVAGGIQGGVFQAWQPTGRTSGTYVTLFQSPLGAQQSAAAVWQGFFAETVSAAAPTFQFDYDAAVPTTPPFIGRPTLAAGVALSLSGLTAAGDSTLDLSALVRFVDGATLGWDAFDASKLIPPTPTYALIAPTLDRDGAAYRVTINALPADATEALIPLSLTTSHAGIYTLDADLDGLPEGWTAELRDTVTGTVSDLTIGYTFTAEATDWTDRFVLALRAGAATGTEGAAVTDYSLAAPSPNPTAGAAVVSYDVPEASTVRVAVYDLLGRQVAVLAQGEVAAGRHTARLEAGALAPGVYVVRMDAGTFSAVRRVTVVR
ncbi:MAG TPA: T9SS type A sorting domain-containing protein, partial [Rubricoccaceae bacterium]